MSSRNWICWLKGPCHGGLDRLLAFDRRGGGCKSDKSLATIHSLRPVTAL